MMVTTTMVIMNGYDDDDDNNDEFDDELQQLYQWKQRKVATTNYANRLVAYPFIGCSTSAMACRL